MKKILALFVIWPWIAVWAYGAECPKPPAKMIDLSLASTKSLVSPDQHWRFISNGPTSSEEVAELFIQDRRSAQKWRVGTIDRNGRAFWSEDSKRLFLRDEYAADDTKIRVFDVSGPKPTEIRGLDDKIRKAVMSRIPDNEETQWLYYPQACFAVNDSTAIILVADAPVVKKRESSEGKDFRLKLTVDLNSFQIEIAAPKAPKFR